MAEVGHHRQIRRKEEAGTLGPPRMESTTSPGARAPQGGGHGAVVRVGGTRGSCSWNPRPSSATSTMAMRRRGGAQSVDRLVHASVRRFTTPIARREHPNCGTLPGLGTGTSWRSGAVPRPDKCPACCAGATSHPGREGGIGFDDVVFSALLQRFIVPGGEDGKSVPGRSGDAPARGDRGADQASELERGTRAGRDVGRRAGGHALRGGPDGAAAVRDPAGRKGERRPRHRSRPGPITCAVEPTGEVWVTEPDAAAIEIFRFEAKEKPTLVRSGSIAVADGPESLIIDAAHGRVFTNTRHDRTLAIGLRERSVVAEWKNGCKDARGLDAD